MVKKLNVANHAYGEWRVTKPATETEEGSKARDCTVLRLCADRNHSDA